jgi:hypothetical protein
MQKIPIIPSICLHKPTGQAYVRLNGRVRYCGKHGTPEAQACYDRLVSEWLASGRGSHYARSPSTDGLDVAEVLAAFWTHAQAYCTTPGRTSERDNLDRSMKHLRP